MTTKAAPSPAAEFMDHKGVTAIFGLSRPYLYQLQKSGAIRSKSFRKAGQQNAKRLWDVASIRAHINSLPQ